jgi:predicted oxidoreductase
MSRFIQHAAGLNFHTFDMADIYGDHTTEAEFGQAWKTSGLNRDSLEFITKTGIVMESRSGDGRTKHYNHSREHIIKSCEQSLKNLQTDYIDVFLIHRPGPLMSFEEMAEAATSLRQAGKIRHFGVSNFTATQVNVLSGYTAVHSHQLECSLAHFKSMLNGDLDICMEKGIAPMAWAPLGKVFARDNEQTRRIMEVVTSMAAAYDCPEDIILYKWLKKHPSGIIPVVGTTREDRLSSLVQYNHIDLTDMDWYSLWSASMGHKVP